MGYVKSIYYTNKQTNKLLFRVILEDTVREVAILEVRTFLRNQRNRLAAQACKR